jgi:hypothetical protein
LADLEQGDEPALDQSKHLDSSLALPKTNHLADFSQTNLKLLILVRPEAMCLQLEHWFVILGLEQSN